MDPMHAEVRFNGGPCVGLGSRVSGCFCFGYSWSAQSQMIHIVSVSLHTALLSQPQNLDPTSQTCRVVETNARSSAGLTHLSLTRQLTRSLLNYASHATHLKPHQNAETQSIPQSDVEVKAMYDDYNGREPRSSAASSGFSWVCFGGLEWNVGTSGFFCLVLSGCGV